MKNPLKRVVLPLEHVPGTEDPDFHIHLRKAVGRVLSLDGEFPLPTQRTDNVTKGRNVFMVTPPVMMAPKTRGMTEIGCPVMSISATAVEGILEALGVSRPECHYRMSIKFRGLVFTVRMVEKLRSATMDRNRNRMMMLGDENALLAREELRRPWPIYPRRYEVLWPFLDHYVWPIAGGVPTAPLFFVLERVPSEPGTVSCAVLPFPRFAHWPVEASNPETAARLREIVRREQDALKAVCHWSLHALARRDERVRFNHIPPYYLSKSPYPHLRQAHKPGYGREFARLPQRHVPSLVEMCRFQFFPCVLNAWDSPRVSVDRIYDLNENSPPLPDPPDAPGDTPPDAATH